MPRLEGGLKFFIAPANYGEAYIQAGVVNGARVAAQGTHAVSPSNEQDHGLIGRPAELPAQSLLLLQRRAITVSNGEADDLQLLRRHMIGDGALVSHLGGHENDVGAGVEPEGVGGHHVCDDRVKRRAVGSERLESERVRHRVNRDDQLGGMVTDKLEGGDARNRPEGCGESADAGAAVGGVKGGLPEARRLDHLRINFGHAAEGRRRVVLVEVDHFRGEGLAVLQMQGFDDGLCCGAMAAAGI